MFSIRDTITAGCTRMMKLLGVYVGSQAERFAKIAEQRAQQNAPWEDRTGDARNGLTGSAETTGVETTITLAHTVDYGLWLEVRWNGRYAIIMPTLEELMPEFELSLGGFGSLRTNGDAGAVTISGGD
jgi:hypothetical protein